MIPKEPKFFMRAEAGMKPISFMRAMKNMEPIFAMRATGFVKMLGILNIFI
jgi:hypothetical protein